MVRTAENTTSEVEVFRNQARTTHQVVRICVKGITHDDSLIRPQAGGNCLNWVVGHLLWAYQGALSVLGQEPVMQEGALKQYARHSLPLQDPDAVEFDKLLTAWDESSRRIDAGLARLTPEVLDRPAPGSPTGDPNETVRSFLTVTMFHQAYHAGQTAILRRITGREGAIN